MQRGIPQTSDDTKVGFASWVLAGLVEEGSLFDEEKGSKDPASRGGELACLVWPDMTARVSAVVPNGLSFP